MGGDASAVCGGETLPLVLLLVMGAGFSVAGLGLVVAAAALVAATLVVGLVVGTLVALVTAGCTFIEAPGILCALDPGKLFAVFLPLFDPPFILKFAI